MRSAFWLVSRALANRRALSPYYIISPKRNQSSPRKACPWVLWICVILWKTQHRQDRVNNHPLERNPILYGKAENNYKDKTKTHDVWKNMGKKLEWQVGLCDWKTSSVSLSDSMFESDTMLFLTDNSALKAEGFLVFYLNGQTWIRMLLWIRLWIKIQYEPSFKHVFQTLQYYNCAKSTVIFTSIQGFLCYWFYTRRLS